MKRFFVIILILFGLQAALFAQAEKNVIGYYMSWTQKTYPPDAVPWDNLTHIVHAFAWPEANGQLKAYDSFFQPGLIKKARERGVKVLLGVGGWGNCDGFSPAAHDPGARARLIGELVSACCDHGYDGIDLDWEYPEARDRDALTTLVVELRRALDKEKIPLLTAAVPSYAWRGGYDARRLADHMDWFGLMTYDYHGPWSEQSGHNAPIYAPPGDKSGCMAHGVDFWLQKQNVPPEKLRVGVPFYGRRFESEGLYRECSDGRMISYATAAQLKKHGWKYHWDDLSKVPWLKNDASKLLVTYDNARSVKAKCEFVREKNLGGVIIWALGQDRIPGEKPDQPLLNALGEELLGSKEK